MLVELKRKGKYLIVNDQLYVYSEHAGSDAEENVTRYRDVFHLICLEKEEALKEAEALEGNWQVEMWEYVDDQKNYWLAPAEARIANLYFRTTHSYTPGKLGTLRKPAK